MPQKQINNNNKALNRSLARARCLYNLFKALIQRKNKRKVVVDFAFPLSIVSQSIVFFLVINL